MWVYQSNKVVFNGKTFYTASTFKVKWNSRSIPTSMSPITFQVFTIPESLVTNHELNFMCQLDCHWVPRLNSISECVWGCFWMNLNQCTQYSVLPSPMQVDIVQSIEDLNRTKGRRRKNVHLFSCLTSWAGTSHLISCRWTGSHTIGSPVSQAFGQRLNCTTSSPQCPACRWQIVRLPSLHDHVSQFPHNKFADILFPCEPRLIHCSAGLTHPQPIAVSGKC